MCSYKLNITSHFSRINYQLGTQSWSEATPTNNPWVAQPQFRFTSAPRQPNLSAVPNFCNAATHSTRRRERDHERGSLSGKERPCSAALRMRTTTAHYLAGCWRCRRRMRSTILPFTNNAGSVFRKSRVTDTQASAQKQLTSIYNNTRVLQWTWWGTLT